VCVSINGSAAAVSRAGLFALIDSICIPAEFTAVAESTSKLSDGDIRVMDSGDRTIEDEPQVILTEDVLDKDNCAADTSTLSTAFILIDVAASIDTVPSLFMDQEQANPSGFPSAPISALPSCPSFSSIIFIPPALSPAVMVRNAEESDDSCFSANARVDVLSNSGEDTVLQEKLPPRVVISMF
jgi:hypothetical protein